MSVRPSRKERRLGRRAKGMLGLASTRQTVAGSGRVCDSMWLHDDDDDKEEGGDVEATSKNDNGFEARVRAVPGSLRIRACYFR